jgi:DDE superfamily endonuclease
MTLPSRLRGADRLGLRRGLLLTGHKIAHRRRLHVIAYRATLDVPRELVQFTARLLLAERRRRGTPKGSRALTCFWEAVLGLRWFRDRASPEALARDHGISRATAYRYKDEVIAVLAEQARDLHQALERARDDGFAHVILDGKIIPCDRCKEPAVSVKGQLIDLWYSGKAHCHGGNIQAVLAPDGFPLWISDVEPGSVHDLTAARTHALPALYRAAATGLPTLADPGYDGAGIGIHIPVKQPTDGRDLDINTRTRNAIQRSLRCLGERGFALLTGRWRTLQHITASPSKIGDITRAALVLTHFEHGYIT